MTSVLISYVLFNSRECLEDGASVPSLTPCLAQAGLTVKPPASKGYLQAVDNEGNPLCLRCQQPTGQTKQECKVNVWDSRFCSLNCQEEFWIRSNNSYLRAKVFEIEHGVCQLCNLNAQELFLRLRDAPTSQRKSLLDVTWTSKLPLDQVSYNCVADRRQRCTEGWIPTRSPFNFLYGKS